MAWTKRDQVGEPKPKRRSRRESAQSRERREQWRRERDAHLAENPECEFSHYASHSATQLNIPLIEHEGPRDVHHIKPRSLGGTRGETGPLVTLCRAHHRFVEEHRIEARELGLLLRREVSR